MIENIYEFEKQLKKSPLRVSNNKEEIEVLNKIEKELNILIEKLYMPLNVTIIGQVKAGKSTLLNALAGGEIAPTDVTETTATIMKIEYGCEEGAEIIFVNGSTKKDKIENIYGEMVKHHGDIEYFSNIKNINIKKPLKELREIKIVDTPGLGTVTSENEEKTDEFFQESDVVVWVLNGHYLGQLYINNAIERVANMGKPIVAVVNRIDEIDGDREEIEDYVYETLGIYVDKVFLLSAKNAYEGLINSDEKKVNDSGYNTFIEYLKNDIERNSNDVQKQIMEDSLKALCVNEIEVHKIVLKKIKSEKNSIIKALEKIKEEIIVFKKEQQIVIRNWFKNEFLHDKEQQILMINEDDATGIINKVSSVMGFNEERLLSMAEEALNVDSINEELEKLKEIIGNNINNKWQILLKDVTEKIKKDYQKFLNDYEKELKYILDDSDIIANKEISLELKKNIKNDEISSKNTKIAAITASCATVAATVAHALPPLLIAGGLFGGTYIYFNKLTKTKKINAAIALKFSEIRKVVLEKKEKEILGTIDNIFEKGLNTIKENYEQVYLGKTLEDTNVEILDIEVYIIEVNNLLENKKSDMNILIDNR